MRRLRGKTPFGPALRCQAEEAAMLAQSLASQDVDLPLEGEMVLEVAFPALEETQQKKKFNEQSQQFISKQIRKGW